MPRRTYDEAQQTRDRILRSAIDICTKAGYEGLSLSAVAERAKVTRGAVYHHFQNKEGLFLSMVEVLLEEMGRKILAAADKVAAEVPRDTWKALVAGCLTFLAESQAPRYQRIVLTDAPAVMGISRWQALDYAYTTRTLTEALEELRGIGEVSVSDPEAAAQALSGAMNQLSLWVSGGNPASVAEEMLLRLLSSVRAAP